MIRHLAWNTTAVLKYPEEPKIQHAYSMPTTSYKNFIQHAYSMPNYFIPRCQNLPPNSTKGTSEIKSVYYNWYIKILYLFTFPCKTRDN